MCNRNLIYNKYLISRRCVNFNSGKEKAELR